jgi:hypothetical protein
MNDLTKKEIERGLNRLDLIISEHAQYLFQRAYDLCCCGNCIMARSEDWCAEDVGGYCDKWKNDGLTRKDRRKNG